MEKEEEKKESKLFYSQLNTKIRNADSAKKAEATYGHIYMEGSGSGGKWCVCGGGGGGVGGRGGLKVLCKSDWP